MKRHSILSLFLAVAGTIVAGAPSGYYSRCDGLSGRELLEALHEVVGPHDNVGYSGLWNVYATSDVRPEDGSIEDIYSTKHWVYAEEQCGNYSAMGDCYNREHSMPKSWFSEQEPMRSDAHHIFPTDGWVNNKRSNYPFGECSGGTTWTNGDIKALGRLGQSTFPGYSGIVFEPDDMYKGDMARAYFYMAACYNPYIDDWSGDMLAGNSYPAFSSWAVEMLLKWHRKDGVSDKEERRNDAIEKWQHNRNPFIDHPEMAEHIWGDRKDTPWRENDYSDAVIIAPVPGTVVDLGPAGRGVRCSATTYVRALGITSPVNIVVSGHGWSCSPSQLSVEEAVKGSPVIVSYDGNVPGTFAGRMTIASGSLSAEYDVTVTVVDGIPALKAEDVTEDSFTARWINVHGENARYTLDVKTVSDHLSLAGYPREVTASAERYTVGDLDPSTAYLYTLSYGGEVSDAVEVTTGALMPDIHLEVSGDIVLSATAGTPSASVEIVAEAENVSEGYTVTVSGPFELSSDLMFWGSDLELQEEDGHFYLRVNASRPGVYSTSVILSCGSYVNDSYSASAVVRSSEWVETFELPSTWSGYAGGVYEGTVAEWRVTDGNVYDDTFFNGTNVMRFGKTSTSSIELTQSRQGGIGSIAFEAATWSVKNDKTANVEIEYSTDGDEWHHVATATVSSEESTKYSFEVDVKENARVRLRQTSGARWILDNLSLTDHPQNDGVDVASVDLRSWDAMLRDGNITVINNTCEPLAVKIFSVDGVLRHMSSVGSALSVALPHGLYIVVAGNDARRVFVR